MKPKVITSIQEIQKWRTSKESKSTQVGFVPTMGALHEGHATLLREARKQCQEVVLSIFVNPTQFGPHEDFSKYPRTFERDLEIATQEGVDVVFAPTASELYPQGYTTYVDENQLSQPLCGRFRPGHFRGVTTIVLKLFHLVQPNFAYFGLKDAQQFFVLSKMVRDLNLDLEMVGVPTVREADGLALSSRNVYLSPEERKIAPALYRHLIQVQNQLREAPETHRQILQNASQSLTTLGFQIQYFECLTLPEFNPVQSTLHLKSSFLLAIAAYLGKTRLIDNLISNSHPKASVELGGC